MTDTTPRSGLPLLAAAQAQKHVTHNDALIQLDALSCARILDRDLSAPPASPADGDAYLVKATATGDWTGEDGNIAYAVDGGWRFYAPYAGLIAYIADESVLLVFDGSAWVDLASILDFQNVPLLGVNTTADATNKLAVKSSALLFDNTGNGVQAKLNKHASGDTASILYQDNYSGRAEIGLAGDDDFHFKVSPDGSSWFEGLKIARADGAVDFLLDETAIASAATVDLGTAASLRVYVTGTATVTSFGAKANAIRFVRFAGALTLTHNATALILLGGASRTTAANDTGIYVSDASGNWRELQYARAATDPGAARPALISSNSTYIIAASGGDFTSLPTALAFLNNAVIATGVYVNLQVNDGTYAHVSPLVLQSAFSRNIAIAGQHAYSKSMTGVYSSSGSAGAWSYVVNLADVTNIAVNDYVGVPLATGGSNPTYLAGMFKITAVDAVNNRIAFTSTHRAASAASGACAATVTIFKSILTFAGCDGFDVWNGSTTANLDKLAIVGDGSAANGVSVEDDGRLYVATALGVAGFGNANVLANYGSEINATVIFSSGSGAEGFLCTLGAAIEAVMVASGNAGDGIHAKIGGSINAATSTATGNGGNGVHAELGGDIVANNGYATGNTGYGYLSESQGFVSSLNSTVANNVAGDRYQHFQTQSQSVAGIGGGVFNAKEYLSGSHALGLHRVSTENRINGSIYVNDLIDGGTFGGTGDGNGLVTAYGRGGDGSTIISASGAYIDGTSNRGHGIWAHPTYSSGTLAAGIPDAFIGTNYGRLSKACTVSQLPAAATARAGARGFVTDATSSTFGATASGGGSNAVPVWCDGSAWKIG